MARKSEHNGNPDAKDNLCWAYSGGKLFSVQENSFMNTLPVDQEKQKTWCRP